MNTIKPDKFSLYWVSDDIGQDWFVITPSFKDCPEFYEIDLAEECHSYNKDLEFDLYGGGVYPMCNAQFVCHIPYEAMENNYINTFSKSGTVNGSISFLEASQAAYVELEDKIGVIPYVLNKEILPNLPNDIVDIINSSEDPINHAYDFFLRAFESTKEMIFMFDTVYGVEDEDLPYIVLEFLNMVRMRNNVEFFGHDKPYGCITGSMKIISQIEGMSFIDNGRKSKHRTVVYDGVVYQEGTNVIQINRTKL